MAAHDPGNAVEEIQQQLAEALGIAQQTLAHYEVARLRVPASMLPALAEIFKVQVDELVGRPVVSRASKRGPASQLERSIERISQLPKTKQRFVLEMIDTVLAQSAQCPRPGNSSKEDFLL